MAAAAAAGALTTTRLPANLNLLASRLLDATRWARVTAQTSDLQVGYFGSSTGAAAALLAAAQAVKRRRT